MSISVLTSTTTYVLTAGRSLTLRWIANDKVRAQLGNEEVQHKEEQVNVADLARKGVEEVSR